MVTMMIPSTAFAYSVKISSGEETVKTLSDGTVIQYYADNSGKILWEMYYSKSKVIQKTGEYVYRIEFTPIDKTHNKFVDKGVYMEFTNIAKKGK